MFLPRSLFALLLSIFALTALLPACRKSDKLDSNPALQLAFSTDTVFFDTVFPTVGSITQRLLVYNDNAGKLKISSITLGGGPASCYRINVNGTPAFSLSDIEIPGKDSLFIFVRVTVDPQSTATPFVVDDSLEFVTNGNRQTVKLVAWGRDAIFYKERTLTGNVVWDSLRAHVVYGALRVDTNASLTVMPGTRIYFHMGAGIDVSYGAQLKINGNLEHPVRLQGDRLDPYYKDLPGQWNGISLERGSRDHSFTNAVIRNGIYGVAADSLGSEGRPMLTLTDCIIQNMTRYGIYAYGSSVAAVNLVLGDCGRCCFAADYGGQYDFTYLTAANFWNASVRQSPAVNLSNYAYDDSGNKITNALVKASFTNTIVYGSNEEEIGLDTLPGIPFAYSFDHALLRTQRPVTNPNRYTECLVNKNPVFVDENKLDYRIDSISPAIGAGREAGIPFDLRGITRGTPPALGAYEYVKEN